jgi:hypothetical protein
VTADLVAFLRQRLQDDEDAARGAADSAGTNWIGTMESGNPWRYSDGQGVYTWSEEGVESDRPQVAAVQWEPVQDHIARHDPARVLADVQAKRAILKEHPSEGPIDEHWSWSRLYPWCTTCSDADDGPTYWPCRTVLLLASVYADHPDFDPAWAVSAVGDRAHPG